MAVYWLRGPCAGCVVPMVRSVPPGRGSADPRAGSGAAPDRMSPVIHISRNRHMHASLAPSPDHRDVMLRSQGRAG